MNYLSGPGKGVILIKLQSNDDRVLGFIASTGDRDLMRVETSRGSEQTISTTKYEVTGRGGKGRELLQRGQFTRVIPHDVENPVSSFGMTRTPNAQLPIPNHSQFPISKNAQVGRWALGVVGSWALVVGSCVESPHQCPLSAERASALTKSNPCSAPVGWARCIAPATRA